MYEVQVENPEAYGGQETLQVETDGRDWAAMELREFPPSAKVTMARFMAWSALRRGEHTKRTWEQFNQRDCVTVLIVDQGDSEDEQSVDPGQRAASDDSESTSLPSRASRSKALRD